MLELTNLLYNEIITLAKNKIIPYRIYSIIYDPRFTPIWIINDIKSNKEKQIDYDKYDSDSCYYYIMEELSDFVNNINLSLYICDSIDLDDENTIYGDYLFYIGFINDNIPFLYMESSHMFEYPPRLILYGSKFQIEINSDKIGIDVYKTVPSIRNQFFINDEKERILSIKDMLFHSDRPRINI